MSCTSGLPSAQYHPLHRVHTHHIGEASYRTSIDQFINKYILLVYTSYTCLSMQCLLSETHVFYVSYSIYYKNVSLVGVFHGSFALPCRVEDIISRFMMRYWPELFSHFLFHMATSSLMQMYSCPINIYESISCIRKSRCTQNTQIFATALHTFEEKKWSLDTQSVNTAFKSFKHKPVRQ